MNLLLLISHLLVNVHFVVVKSFCLENFAGREEGTSNPQLLASMGFAPSRRGTTTELDGP